VSTHRATSHPERTAPPVTTAPATGTPFTVAPVKVAPADKQSTGDGRVDEVVALILGGAVLLGIGGLSGLYLTRERES
jgi:hypothetical protein